MLATIVIEEANWLSLPEDIEDLVGDGFDALICMGNSFAHLPDFGGEQKVSMATKSPTRNDSVCCSLTRPNITFALGCDPVI